MIVKKIIFIFILFFIPGLAKAAVLINEIAWMGSLESANHEWIELYNSESEAVNVDGWTLEDGVNLKIKLSGSIGPQSYAVLERTSDDSSPASAFLIYTGALVNSGATLTLRNGNGGVMDQVFGGEEWSAVGGDNSTKDTAQYTEKGWVTDIATPSEKNRSGRVVEKEESNSKSKVAVSSEKTTTKSSLEKTGLAITKTPVPALSAKTLSLISPEIAFVNQKIKFSTILKGASKTKNKSLIYYWNFGDSYSDTGRESEHFYSYPGTFVVTVLIRDEGVDVIDRREIKILPVSFSITKNESGDVQINNDAPYLVDMSGFKISGGKSVIFPENSVILPKSTITIAKGRLLNGENELIILYDAFDNTVASTWAKNNPFSLKKMPSDISLESVKNIDHKDLEFVKVDFKKPQTKSTALLPDNFNFVKKAEAKVENKPETSEATAENISNKFTEKEIVAEEETGRVVKKEENIPEENSSNDTGNNWAYLFLVGLLSLALFGLYNGKTGK